MKFKHFPRYWPFARGNHRFPVNSLHKGQLRGALMFSLICVWINGWVNNREAGDLRRHCAHYDVIVMFQAPVVTTHLWILYYQCTHRWPSSFMCHQRTQWWFTVSNICSLKFLKTLLISIFFADHTASRKKYSPRCHEITRRCNR